MVKQGILPLPNPSWCRAAFTSRASSTCAFPKCNQAQRRLIKHSWRNRTITKCMRLCGCCGVAFNVLSVRHFLVMCAKGRGKLTAFGFVLIFGGEGRKRRSDPSIVTWPQQNKSERKKFLFCFDWNSVLSRECDETGHVQGGRGVICFADPVVALR